MKLLVSLFVLLSIQAVSNAQTWEKRELGGLKYEFPTPNQKINTPEAFGVSYEGENLFLTVTSIPDTTDFKPETQLDRSRYYAATAASVMFRLRGKMVAAQDTMIDDAHLYYSALEVLMPDSAISKYELLQYLEKDTLHGFSCQYILSDKAGLEVRNRFYDSVRFTRKISVSPFTAFIIGGAALVMLIVVLLYRSSQKRKLK
jgi:hypothetical protein